MKKKRVRSLLLCLALLLGLLPMRALGAEEPASPAGTACTATEGCSLEEGHEGGCVLYEARYQAEEGGEWVYDALADACAYVYAGGRVEVLRDIELEDSSADTYTYGETDTVKAKGIIVTKPMTITSAGDTPRTITYSPKNNTHDQYYMTKILDHLINASPAGGELYLENIILDGGREKGGTSKAELVSIRNGTLTLGSGAILQNNDNTFTCGGLLVRDGAAVMLEGSVIRDCRGDEGGGARVTAAASADAAVPERSSLTLKGGIIEDCEAPKGGGVYIKAGGQFMGPSDDEYDEGDDSSKLCLYSGSIRGNKASGSKGYGGGIYIEEKRFGSCHVYMDGATIEENTARFGGGIYILNGKVHLKGGAVTKNHAERYGGGIYVTPEQDISECDVILSGAAVVDGNTSTDSDPVDKCFYDVYLEGSEDFAAYGAPPTHPMTVEASLTDGASIGVSRWTRPDDTHLYRVVARPAEGYEITTADLDKFYSDDPKYVTLLHQNGEDPTDPDNGTIVITHADVAFDNQGHGRRPPSQLIDAEKMVAQPQDLTERGYTFESWYTEPECTTEWNFAEDKVETDVKPQVLYAGWKLNHYLIEYDVGEGGENNAANPHDYTVESDAITLEEPTRAGYGFMGWTLTELNEDLVESTEPLHPASRSGRSVRSDLADEQQDGIPTGSIGYRKFTAQWRKLPPYTVTYTDGVEGEEVFPDQVDGDLENNALTPGFRGGTPTRTGYTFAGWSPEVAERVRDDATYVAQWDINVTFDVQGHGAAPEGQVVPYGGNAAQPDDPTESGWNFGGWYREPECTTPWNFETDAVTEPVTLYARWDINSYPVTFDVQGHGAAPEGQSVVYGGCAAQPDDPTESGWQFGGWYREPECTTPWNFDADVVTEPVTLYARWEKKAALPPVDPPARPDPPPALESGEHFAYIVGYPDGTVRPEAYISRAEMATLFFRLMTDEFRAANRAETTPFPDVTPDDWYFRAVSTAVQAGLIGGLPDGTFGGDRPATRAEFAVVAARFLSEETAPDSGFSDLEGHWAKAEIDRAVAAGWLYGFPDGTFRPDDYITRAQAMTQVNRMLGRVPAAGGMLREMFRWPDNPEGAWYYADVQEATHSHTYDRKEKNGPETWTGLTEDPDWLALEAPASDGT